MSGLLRNHFRAALSANVLAFMDDIERQSGQVIDIVHQPAGVTAAMGMYCLPGKICIEIPPSGAIHEPAALHELQHMERYLVHEIPMMGAAGNPDVQLVGQLENPVEHLVIVPRAARWRLLEQAFWDQQIRDSWFNIEAGVSTWPYTKQQAIRLEWMSTFLAEDPAAIALGEAVLTATGPTEERETRDLRDQILSNLDNKADVTEIVCAGLGIASRRVQLQIYDKASHQFKFRNL